MIKTPHHDRGTGKDEENQSFSKSELDDLLFCKCKDRYTIEPHGKGYAIYWGRCMHRHGANLGQITECHRTDIIKFFEEALNEKAAR